MSAPEVTLATRVDALVADASMVQDSMRRLAILDEYLALPAEHPHPQIKRIRDEHASHVGTFLIALRNTADRFVQAAEGAEVDPVSLDVAIRGATDDRIKLSDIGPALLNILNNGVTADQLCSAVILADSEVDR